MFHCRYYYGRRWLTSGLGISQTFFMAKFGESGVSECTELTAHNTYEQSIGTKSRIISVCESTDYHSFFDQMTRRMTRHYHITNV